MFFFKKKKKKRHILKYLKKKKTYPKFAHYNFADKLYISINMQYLALYVSFIIRTMLKDTL